MSSIPKGKMAKGQTECELIDLPVDFLIEKTIGSQMSFSVSLSSRGLSTLPYQKNFTFIVGHKKYHCSFVTADFVSPKISKFHFADPTLDCYIKKRTLFQAATIKGRPLNFLERTSEWLNGL
jgi:hypothetical protein